MRDDEEQCVRETVLAKLAADPETYLTAYRDRFGNVLNADDAASLFEDYNQDRAKYRAAAHPAAAWIRDELFRRSLAEEKSPERSQVVFTAGSNAASKTSAIQVTLACEEAQDGSRFHPQQPRIFAPSHPPGVERRQARDHTVRTAPP
jgi:hypothetical protein